VRDYYGQPLEAEDIDYILACASTAPSAGNREAWDVVVVTDDDIRLELSSAALNQVHVREAPAVFVVCANYVCARSSISRSTSVQSPSSPLERGDRRLNRWSGCR